MLQYLKTKEEREEFINKYDNFLFDCDGKPKNKEQGICGLMSS